VKDGFYKWVMEIVDRSTLKISISKHQDLYFYRSWMSYITSFISPKKGVIDWSKKSAKNALDMYKSWCN
jgi:hypothetical protein